MRIALVIGAVFWAAAGQAVMIPVANVLALHRFVRALVLGATTALPGTAALSLVMIAAFIVFSMRASAASDIPVEIGLNFTAARGSGPPDVMGAVGEQHVVHFINGQFKVFRKTDGASLVDISSFAFWASAGLVPTDNFDPRVVYDSFVQRWYAVETDGFRSPDNRYLFAVSQTSDPTRGWSAFEIDADLLNQRWADFPTLGFNADGVYLASTLVGNMDTLGLEAEATSVVVLPKADLLLDTPNIANRTEFQNIPLNEINLYPNQTVDLDGTGGAAYMMSTALPGVRQLSTIDDPAGSPSLGGLGVSGLMFLDPAAGGTPTNAEQPGTSEPLWSRYGWNTSNLVLRNGALWGVRMVNGFGGETTTQWFQIDPETRTVLQSGLIEEPGLNLIFPSIAVNEFEQVAIGFTGVGENEFASAYAIVGETLNGVTVFGELVLLKAGQSEYEVIRNGRNRWGDYSTTVVDPEDSRVFWTFQEWAEFETGWATQITQLVIPEPTTACNDALDNDNDGNIDSDDFGCAGALDTSERAPDLPCDDGVDNDGDGFIDFIPDGDGDGIADPPGDPGCFNALWNKENPQCQDGTDNDFRSGIDFDGGVSIWGVAVDEADPECAGRPWRDFERRSGCGLGAELILVLLPLVAVRRWRQPRRLVGGPRRPGR